MKGIVLEKRGEITVREFDPRPPEEGEIRADAIISGISHGTEMTVFKGSNPQFDKQWDADARLFVSREKRKEGFGPLGYEWVGKVVAVGSGAEGFREGQLVLGYLSHKGSHTAKADRFYRLPEGMKPERGIFCALGVVALSACHDASIKLGDRVGVFGLGTIGLVAVQMARLEGATQLFAVDPIASRREMAKQLGADCVCDPLSRDVGRDIKRLTDGKGVDASLELSGSYEALQSAMRATRSNGRVVSAGFYQGDGSALRLGEEWHHNQLTMVATQPSWHNVHREFPLWDTKRLVQTVIKLLAEGTVVVEDLITHRFPIAEAQKAYETIAEQPEKAIKVALVYP